MTEENTGVLGDIHRGLDRMWDTVWWYARQMGQQFFEHNCLNSAGSLTYTTLFAVVPMMTVTYTFFSILPEYAQLGEQVQSFIFQNFVPGSSNIVQEKLAEFASRARNLTAFGFLFLFVTAFLMLVTIEKTFNTIWHITEPRRGLQRFLLYWAVLSLGPAFVVVGMLVSLYLVSLPLVSGLGTLGLRETLLGYLPLVLNFAGFTVLYYAVPNCHVPFRHAMLGGLVSTIVFQAALNVFAQITRGFSYDAVYGTFAAVPVFLLWLYLAWVVVLGGAIFVRCLSLPRDREANPEPLLIKAARILKLLQEAHMEGRGVADEEIANVVVLNRAEHNRLFNVLQDLKLLSLAESDNWVLGRSLRSVTLWELYQRLPEGLELKRLKQIDDLPQFVGPLISLTQFGSNEMSVSLDMVFAQ